MSFRWGSPGSGMYAALAALMLASTIVTQVEAASTGVVLAKTLATAQTQHRHDALTSCLRTTGVPYCNIDEGYYQRNSLEQYRAELGCCSGGGALPLASDGAVGRCEYTLSYFYSSSLDVPYVYGGFYGTCYLERAAEACIEPACDDMVLSVQGQIYGVEDVVTDDPNNSLLGECYDDFWEANPASSPSARAPSPANKRLFKKLTDKHSSDSKTPTMSGSGSQLYLAPYYYVMSGPMVVFCSKSGLQWSGWFETPVYVGGGVTPISRAAAADKTFMRPDDIMLKIFNHGKHYV